MIDKHPLRPERLRQIPRGFSWVDHRLIRQRRLAGASHGAWALYLFLVTVADAQGLSYYSDAALERHLQLDPQGLGACRRELEAAELIAYRHPLYQVLALLDPLDERAPGAAPSLGQARSVGDILRQALAGGRV